MMPIAIKRISKELQQLKSEPIEGVSVVQLNKCNFQDFIVNIRIQQGPYKGTIVHCTLQLSEKHPQVAPYMTIFMGCGFENSNHHHLLMGNDCIRFCIDLLRDSVLQSTEIGSGWNPAYTIKTLLMQIQQFISDPDRGGIDIPEQVITELQRNNFKFEREFEVNGETVKHTFSVPYPPFDLDNLSCLDNPVIEKIKKDEKENQEEQEEMILEPIRRQRSLSPDEIEEINLFVKEINELNGEYILGDENQSSNSHYLTPRSSFSSIKSFGKRDGLIIDSSDMELATHSTNMNSYFNQNPTNQKLFHRNLHSLERNNEDESEEEESKFPLENIKHSNHMYRINKNLILEQSNTYQEQLLSFENTYDETNILTDLSNSEFKDCVNMSMEFIDKDDPLLNQSLSRIGEDFIKEHLTCYMSFCNPIDDPDQIFGLPVHIQMDQNGKLQSQALTEIITYESFKSILNEHGLKKMTFNKIPYKGKGVQNPNSKKYPVFKSSSGRAFNCWLPLFVNRDHFEKNIKVIEQCISEISIYEGMEFKPFMVLEIIPNLINKMFVNIFDDQDGKISSAAIQAYIQMFQLLINFCEKYPSLQDSLDKKIIDFARSDFNRNKQVIGDFGEFFVILGASSFSFNQFEFLDLLYREQSARQMLWLENNEEFMLEFTAYPQPPLPPFSESDIQELNQEEKQQKEIELAKYKVESEELYEKKMQSVWRQHKIGHNLLIFTIEAAKYLTSKQFLKKIEENYSLVSDEYATHFVQYTRRVRSLINSHKDFLTYLGLGQKYDTFEKVHEVFQIGIFVSNYQGYTRKKQEIDNKLHEYKPNLKYFTLECKRLFNLRLKSQVEVEEKRLPKNLEDLSLEEIKLNGLKEDLSNYQMMDFSQNKIYEQEEKQRSDIFNKSILTFSKDNKNNIDEITKKLSIPMVDQFQSQFVKKMWIESIVQTKPIFPEKTEVKQELTEEMKEERKKQSEKFYKYSKEEKTQKEVDWRKTQEFKQNEPPKEIVKNEEKKQITVEQRQWRTYNNNNNNEISNNRDSNWFTTNNSKQKLLGNQNSNLGSFRQNPADSTPTVSLSRNWRI